MTPIRGAGTAVALLVMLGCAMPVGAADLPAGLVDPYLKAQTLLAEDKVAGVADAARAMQAAAAPLGKAGEGIVASAKKLGAATKLENARTAFGDLSLALIAYAEGNKSGLGANLHVAYCPMADKPWIQKGEDIKNPYYGSEMLTCGMIKK